MLAILGLVLIIAWVIGLLAHVTVWAIHLALIIGAVLIIAHFFTGRRTVAP